METGKKHLSIEELFRQKLENAEVIPGVSVKAGLMRRLYRKEFLRFNPSRFNIYYAGIAAAALVTAGVLFFSNHERDGKNQQNIEIPGETPVNTPGSVNATDISDKSVRSAPVEEISSSGQQPKSLQEPDQQDESPKEDQKTGIVPTVLSGSVSKDLQVTAKEATKELTIPAGNTALFEPSAVSGCAPLKIHFDNLADSYASYSWTFGDGGFSREKEPDWIYDVEGEYLAILKASDANGKTSLWSVSIKVFPGPKAKFEISPENALLPIDEIRFINYSTGATAYRWEFGDGNNSSDFEPVHKYLKYGRYDVQLVAYSENGCSDTLVIRNAYAGSDYTIEMPNAFIPNPYGPSGGLYSSKSDENAEVFHPVSSGVTNFQMRIFSKTGVLIFESNDINIGWDGYLKGQLCPPGVYAWKIRGNFSNGEPFTKMGDVTLLKN